MEWLRARKIAAKRWNSQEHGLIPEDMRPVCYYLNTVTTNIQHHQSPCLSKRAVTCNSCYDRAHPVSWVKMFITVTEHLGTYNTSVLVQCSKYLKFNIVTLNLQPPNRLNPKIFLYCSVTDYWLLPSIVKTQLWLVEFSDNLFCKGSTAWIIVTQCNSTFVW